MRYTTRDGVVVEVGRIDRRRLDEIAIVEPAPPLRKVETWGGVFEEVPVYDDPHYLAEVFEYHLKLWREQLAVVAGGVEIETSARVIEDLAAISEIFGEVSDAKTTYLRYCMSDIDRAAIVENVLYLSTVTQRGINEACGRFGYKWRGKQLEAWHVPTSYGERGKLAVEWRAAVRSGVTWAQFCELPGSEQSAHVAFWMLEDKLNYLISSQ